MYTNTVCTRYLEGRQRHKSRSYSSMKHELKSNVNFKWTRDPIKRNSTIIQFVLSNPGN